MTHCPACKAEIPKTALPTARCPHCLAMLNPAAGAKPRRGGMRGFLRRIVDRTGEAKSEHSAPGGKSQQNPNLPSENVAGDAFQPASDFVVPSSADAASEETSERTISESDFTIGFIDMDSLGTSEQPGAGPVANLPPPENKPPRELGETISESDFGAGLIELDPGEVTEPEPEVLRFAPVEPTDSGRTLTDSDYTVAFIEPGPQAAEAADSEQTEPVLPIDPSSTSGRTITESDYTIAFDPTAAAEEESPVEEAPVSPTGRTLSENDYTVAFVDPLAASEALANSQAEENGKAGQTINASDMTIAFSPPAEGAQPAADLDFDLASDTGTPPSTRATRNLGATVDVGELPAEQLEMLTGMWGSEIPSDARPGMTIRSAAEGQTQTHLVVRPRTVRAPEQPALDGADYELLETIGKGGMGVVYAARQASIDRTVAIKMIRGDMAANVEQRHKFLSEAVVTGDLDHPNIVPIYDLGSNESGALFYSMKRVQGTPWIKVLKQKSAVENIEILMKVADAVAFAHSRGVVHRDLKPENVMLGEYGEVLVMDWGLALLAPRFRHLGTITQSGGMGGTPAYMAPEMASGPLDRIGIPSDVYLLGAILFEIITGKPPHGGSDVMSCLYAVARNEIQPTTETGELMEIARKAMSTAIEDRYPSVLEFQAAIRLYHSHSESSLLSDRAEEDLAKADKSGDYQDFARAVFGFQEALALWHGNQRAARNLLVAKSKYATCAVTKGDFDLAASLLDANEPSFAELRGRVLAAQRERDVRQRRLKFFMRAAQAMVATVVIVVGSAFFLIRAQRDRAVTAEEVARHAEDDARHAEEDARHQAKLARAAEADAEQQRDAAVAAEGQAKEERDRAEVAESQAREDRDKALIAEKAEAALRAQEEILRQQKEYEAYIAQIGLVSAKIDENAFGYAAQLLDECPSTLRNWEWGRLMHLCRQSAQTFRAEGPVESVCYSPDGTRVLTGSWEGKAHVWDVVNGQKLLTMQHGMYVHSVAWSPDGQLVATGSDDKTGEIKLWNAATGELIRTCSDHSDAVLSIVFSRDGKRFLTGSYDNTARLWDTESGELLRTFQGHTWWVWSAAFSPDETQVVTASQDGTAIVWTVASETKPVPFRGHTGPVYSAAFSPDGKHIATGGYDKRILIWRPDQVQAFDASTLLGQHAAAPPSYTALNGHAAPVRSVTFSADGTTLASASHDNTIKLWDLTHGHCRQTLRGHAGWVRSCVFSPDGQSIVSAGYDQQAKIWRMDQYEEVRSFGGHEDALLAAAFSPDGKQIVTASRDRTAKIRDADGHHPPTTLSEGHAFLVSTAAFSPDGQNVFTGAGDDTIRQWNAATGGQRHTYEHTGRGGIFALSADGKLMLTGGDAGNGRLWDIATGTVLKELAAHKLEITAVAISPDNRLLFTGDAVGHGRIWDADSGKELHRVEGHSRKITAAYFVSNHRLVTASTDNSVGQWDVDSGKEDTAHVLKHPQGVVALAVSADGNFAATACEDKHVRVWRLADARLLKNLDAGPNAITSVQFSPDNRSVLTACADHKVRLWDLATGAQVGAPANGNAQPLLDTGHATVWLARFSPDGTHIVTAGGNDARLWHVASGREVTAFSPHGAVAAAAFSPDGQRVATCSWDGSVKIWNAATGTVEAKFVASPNKYVNSIVYSPDGSHLLTASDDKTAKIWDAQTGALVMSLPPDGVEGHSADVRTALFSPDGKFVVTASSDKTARIWDVETGKTLVTLTGHEWAVLAAAFSQDGTRVITGSEDKTARIWNVADGKQLHVLTGHTASVTTVAFSKDGSRAATGGQDNAVKLWDAQTSKEILHLKHHTQEISTVVFAPNGKSLLTSSRDGTAVLWPAIDWH